MYDILIIGSGLSSMSFLSGLSIKSRKVALISPYNLKFKKNDLEKTISKYIKKNLPPRFNEKKNISNILNYFVKNKIKLNDDVSVFGNLDDGGVSNYWGGSCEFLKENDITFLNNSNKKDLINAFLSIYKKFNFSGKIEIPKNYRKYFSSKKIKINPIFKDMIKDKSNNKLKFFHNCIAQNYKTGKTFLPKNIISKKLKNINKLNYFVNKIKKNKKGYTVYCENNYKKFTIKTKKLVLGAGTISSTKLVCDMLKVNKSIVIDHNPMLFGLFILRKKIKLEKFAPAKLSANIHLNNKKFSTVNFRSSNAIIKNKIFKNFYFLNNFFTKLIFKLFEKNMLFLNLYLDSYYGNLSFTLDKKKNVILQTDNKKFKKIKNKLFLNFNILYNYLKNKKIIYPFVFKLIPKMGNDNHYTGTIPINGKDNKMSLKENCELKGYKDFYVIDGSGIPRNSSKFPTPIIIANSFRAGLKFK